MSYTCTYCGKKTGLKLTSRLPYFGLERPEEEVPIVVSSCCEEPLLKNGKLYTYEDFKLEEEMDNL